MPDHIVEFEFAHSTSSDMIFKAMEVDGNQLAVLASAMEETPENFSGPSLLIDGPTKISISFVADHSLNWIVMSTASHRQVCAAKAYLKVYAERLMAMSIMQAEAANMAGRIELARALPFTQ